MIWDVDASLRSLLEAEALDGSGAEIVFDAPTTQWAARLGGPAVDVFLYDIHEDTERRNSQAIPVRDATGRITGRRPGARFFRMSYLLTAWTTRAEDEHRLLGQLLQNLVRFDRLPLAHLKGRLEGQTISITTAVPPAGDRSVSDLWTAVGGEMKPSLDLVLVVPLEPATSFVAGPPVQERDLRVVRKDDGLREE